MLDCENHEFQSGARYLLQNCGSLQPDDSVLIIFDQASARPAQVVLQTAKSMTPHVRAVKISVPTMHGQEPPEHVADLMISSTLILGMTSKSIAHTKARMAACLKGARYLSLPEYSLDLLKDPSLTADYRGLAKSVKAVADVFTRGSSVSIRTSLGTDLFLSITGRRGNYCPGFVQDKGDLGSPPDIEANVSPVENQSEGILVVDGSIPYPGLGLLKDVVTLEIEKGLIKNIQCRNSFIINKLNQLFQLAHPMKTKVLAELGIGLNPKATLQGIMLTDEGAAGTAHCGFGSNSTVGGQNDVSFHLDFVFCKPTLLVDRREILKEGVLCLL